MSKAREAIEKILSEIRNSPNPEESGDKAAGFKTAFRCVEVNIPIAQLLLEIDEKMDKLLEKEK